MKCPYIHEDGICDIDGDLCKAKNPSECRNRDQLIYPNARSWRGEYAALGEMKTLRPIHKLLIAGRSGSPDCTDVCEKLTAKLLEAGFSRKELGISNELDHTKILSALDEVAVVRREPNFTRTERGERILWCILEDDAQEVARRMLGRRLSEDELSKVKRSLEYGLEGWLIALESAIEELETK